MAEQQKRSNKGRGARRQGAAGARRVRKSQSNREARDATARAPEGQATAGRIRVRPVEAAYARAVQEHAEQIRTRIQAAVDAGARIREQIEAKIERQMHEDRPGREERKAPPRKSRK